MNEGAFAIGDVQILQTNKVESNNEGDESKLDLRRLFSESEEPAEIKQKKMHEQMIMHLNRSSGIDRLAFIKALKEAFNKLLVNKIKRDEEKKRAEEELYRCKILSQAKPAEPQPVKKEPVPS